MMHVTSPGLESRYSGGVPGSLRVKLHICLRCPVSRPGKPCWRCWSQADRPIGRDLVWSPPGTVKLLAGWRGSLALNDLLDRPLDDLSGGQRQRVFVGRCLVQEPAALLLDEPNTYLDLKHQVELCQLLRKLSRAEPGPAEPIGVLMASHDLNLASAFSDRVIVMSAGRVVATGAVDILKPQMLSDVYGLKLISVENPSGPPVLIPDAGRTNE